jgi:hypothetical protein
MKCIVVLLSVVALMVVMLAMSVAPAFARWEPNGCRTGGHVVSVFNEEDRAYDRNGDTFICSILQGPQQVQHFYDNRL